MTRWSVVACAVACLVCGTPAQAKKAMPRDPLHAKAREVARLIYEPAFKAFPGGAFGGGKSRSVKQMQREMQAAMKVAMEMVETVFAIYFTDSELDDLIRFYSSPTGQKFARMPQAMMEDTRLMEAVGAAATGAMEGSPQIQRDMQGAARDGVVGAVRSGIVLYRASEIAKGEPDKWPPSLDQAHDGRAGKGNKFFTTVLQEAVTDGAWSKHGNAYTFTLGKRRTVYRYNRTTGTFGDPRQ